MRLVLGCLLLCCICFGPYSFAAFPLHTAKVTRIKEQQPVRQSASITEPQTQKTDNGVLGIFSFLLGGSSFVLFISGLKMGVSFSTLGLPCAMALVACILAIPGIMRRRKLRGLAFAGYILGGVVLGFCIICLIGYLIVQAFKAG